MYFFVMYYIIIAEKTYIAPPPPTSPKDLILMHMKSGQYDIVFNEKSL